MIFENDMSSSFVCSTCKIEMPISMFSLRDGKKRRKQCKMCRKKKIDIWAEKNKKTVENYKKKYYKKNKKIIIDKVSEWRKNNYRRFRDNNNKSTQKWRENNKAKYIASAKKSADKYFAKNREIILEKKREYNHRAKEHQNQYFMNRKKNDISFKIKCNLRSRISGLIKGKHVSHIKELGCTIEYLRQYLEEKFYSNPETGEMMSWENYGFYGWHIDHIIPLSSFDLTNRKQFLKACHYTNLQPLWAKDNLRKRDKLEETNGRLSK